MGDNNIMEQLRDQIRILLVAAYFQEAEQESISGEPAAVICDKCGELTQYSVSLNASRNPYDKLCLSDACIKDALATLAALNMARPQDE